jgi:heat shock protein HtpX
MPLPIDPAVDREHRARNMVQTVLLIAGIGVLLIASTWLIWGTAGALAAVLVVTVLATLAPRVPPELVMRLYRAQPIDAGLDTPLNRIAATLAERAGLPDVPQLYVVPSMTLNAFATGDARHAAIGITEGLLRRLSLRETANVLAHEVSHIRNHDLAVLGLADMTTRLVQAMSYVALALAVLNIVALMSGEPTTSWIAILMLYLAPTASSLLQLALSRAREYDADRSAVALTGDPQGLASALRRLEDYYGRMWEDLAYPFPARRIPQPSLLRSHPSVSDRISRLIELHGKPSQQGLLFPISEGPMTTLVGHGPIELQPRYRFLGFWY